MQLPAALSPRRAFLLLAGISASLVGLHILGLIAWFGFGHNSLKGLVPLFNMEYEYNVPSAWSALMLLSAAVLLGLIAHEARQRRERYRRHWTVLAGIFFLLAVDEFFAFHQRTIEPLSNALHTRGLLYYAWIIPAGVGVVILGLFYARFLFSLPPAVRNAMLAAAVLYVGGALGFEPFEGAIDAAGHWRNLPYMILGTVEEAMEMAGVCVFVYALLRYASMRDGVPRPSGDSRPIRGI